MTQIHFRPLGVRRLSGIIEESIKNLILTGELKVGSKIPSETQISRQFGVSLVTVREALRGLEAFGLIERKRGRKGGTYVTKTKVEAAKNAMQYFLLSEELSAMHLNQVRMIVEPEVAALAAVQITDEDLENLTQNVEYCRNKIKKFKNIIKAKDFFDIEDRHTEFHCLIGEASHNPLLSLLVYYISDFLSAYEKTNIVPDIKYSISCTKYHLKILSSLKEHNSELARKQMLQHVELVGDYLKKEKR